MAASSVKMCFDSGYVLCKASEYNSSYGYSVLMAQMKKCTRFVKSLTKTQDLTSVFIEMYLFKADSQKASDADLVQIRSISYIHWTKSIIIQVTCRFRIIFIY